MGNLLDDKLSNVVATLERLELCGITDKGLKRIRTMSPALLKQLSHIIENGLSDRYRSVPGLNTFDLTLDSSDAGLVKEKMSGIGTFDSLFTQDILGQGSRCPVEKMRFIALSIGDFQPHSRDLNTDNFSSPGWLKNWSNENLLGNYYIAPCSRLDTAIHLALAGDTIPSLNRTQMNIICDKGRKDWIGVSTRRDIGVPPKISIGTSIDFSFGWPAIFELRRVKDPG